MDGKHFVDCTFQSIILRFQGRRPFSLSACKFIDAPEMDVPGDCGALYLMLYIEGKLNTNRLSPGDRKWLETYAPENRIP